MTKQEDLLRKLRGHLAYAKGVKPYVIFKDEELNAILNKKPKTIDELSTLKGFPKDGKRIANWGQSIVDIFTQTDKIEDFNIKSGATGEPVVETKLKRMNLFG